MPVLDDRPKDVGAGVTSLQVALAWTMAEDPAIHPIVGSRDVSQLAENLAPEDLHLPAEARARLSAVSRPVPAFPGDFIAETQEFVYGPVGARVDGRGN